MHLRIFRNTPPLVVNRSTRHLLLWRNCYDNRPEFLHRLNKNNLSHATDMKSMQNRLVLEITDPGNMQNVLLYLY